MDSVVEEAQKSEIREAISPVCNAHLGSSSAISDRVDNALCVFIHSKISVRGIPSGHINVMSGLLSGAIRSTGEWGGGRL